MKIRFGWVLLVIAICGGRFLPNTTAEETPPNIVFIFADDLTYRAVNSLGNPEVQTPNLDALVRQGITFTHAYNQGSWTGAVCVASRTMLNTGRYLWNAHRVMGKLEVERKEGRLWSEYLRGAGYDTYFSGKWHVKIDANKIFTHAKHVRPGMPKQTNAGYNRPLPNQEDPWSPSDPKFGGFWEGGLHWSEVLKNDAVEFLQQAAGRDKPFFMYVAFNAPHDPRQAPQSFVDRYPLDKITVPKNFLPEYPFKDAIACGKNLRDEKLGPFPRTRHSVKVHRQEYYAIITHMDEQIGRILDALKRSGKAENTYVVFTADHGLGVGEHGLFGKQNLFDHSVRVPFMVKGPGIPAGVKNNSPIYLQDIMPTTLQWAGLEKPDHVQFQSLLPLIHADQPQAKTDRTIYGGYLDVQRSVTHGRYKLVLYPKIKKTLLFDLKADPLEMNDVSDDPKNRGIVRKLFAELLRLQKETGDTLDLLADYSTLEN